MPRPILFLALLASLAAAGLYFWNSGEPQESEASLAQKNLAKTYLVNTRSLRYGERGALTEILEATSVRYFPNQNHSVLVAPKYYSHNGNDRTWSVVSDTGRFLDNRELLFLQGNVVLTDDQNEGRLYTEAMQINLQKKTARSRVPVTLKQGLNTITADGMLADLNKEQIRLTPNVESIYAPVSP